VIFLALTAATEVTAIVCACLPVIAPVIFKELKQHRSSSYEHGSSSRPSLYPTASGGSGKSRKNRGFTSLDDSQFTATIYGGDVSLAARTGSDHTDRSDIPLSPLRDVILPVNSENNLAQENSESERNRKSSKILVQREVRVKVDNYNGPSKEHSNR
jgi:hypothetical protein